MHKRQRHLILQEIRRWSTTNLRSERNKCWKNPQLYQPYWRPIINQNIWRNRQHITIHWPIHQQKQQQHWVGISLFHRAFFNSIMYKTPTHALFHSTLHYSSVLISLKYTKYSIVLRHVSILKDHPQGVWLYLAKTTELFKRL